jgi:putative peptidoglycan lipid II flippase
MPAIEGMAYGVLFGGVLQLLCQVPRLYQCGYRFHFSLDWSHPILRRLMMLMLPALFGTVAVQINVIVNTSFASQLSDPFRGHDGPVSWLGYALRFVQLPLGLFGVAIASAMLPAVARDAAVHDFEQFRKTFSRSLSVVLLCTVPSMVILILLGRPIVCAVYQSGRFDAYDAQQTSIALSCYALGLLAFAAIRILTPAFYALCDSRTPMYMSILSVALNVALPLLFIKRLHFGFASLALTTSIAVTVECLMLFVFLRRKLAGIGGRYLLSRFRKIVAASMLMGGSIELVLVLTGSVEIVDRWHAIGQLCVCLPIAATAFGLASYALKIDEVRMVGDAFLFAVKRLLHHPHAKIRT